MAGVLLQTAFSAVAGAGYLFPHLDKSGYKDEMKRHNKALEDLAKAKELFYENEIKKKDEIIRKRQELLYMTQILTNATNKALDNLYRIQTQ